MSRGDRTRQAVLAAARERFARDGFEETTLGGVAADAGVAGPTVAFHFGSKQGLLTAVIADYYEDLVGRARAVVDEPSSPRARLEAFARFWLQAIDGDFALFAVFVAHGGLRDVDSPSGAALHEGNAQVTRVFERLVDDLKADGTLRSEVPTRLVRDAFFGTAEHVLRGQLRSTRRLDHRRAADQVLDLVLHGSATTEPAGRDDDRLASIEGKLDELLRSNAR